MSSWLRRLFRWLRELVKTRQRRLRGPTAASRWRQHTDVLPAELSELLNHMSGEPGVVSETVGDAIQDYVDLHRIVTRTQTSDAVFDATLLASAEVHLRAIIEGAPALESLVALASKRHRDRAGREAAGDALLALRDRARTLADVTSAALQWAAAPSSRSLGLLRERAAELGD